GRVGGQGWEQLGPRLLDDGAGGEEIRESGGNILVGNGHLRFQGVQLAVSEDFPPIAANEGIAGLGWVPKVGGPRTLRGQFLESGGSLDRRRLIFRGEVAAAQ